MLQPDLHARAPVPPQPTHFGTRDEVGPRLEGYAYNLILGVLVSRLLLVKGGAG